MAGGVSGKAILAGDSKNSLLLQRILNHGGMGRMPPTGDPLSAAEVSVIRTWIDAGAEWPDDSQTPAMQTASSEAPDFAKQIEPIFKASCYGCHSGSQPKAGLRLDAKSLALKGGISGKVILPGDGKGSRLIHRVRGLGDEVRMPLKGEPLTEQQIELLRKWIDAGALWPGDEAADEAKIEKHWAYVKPVRPALPQVKNTAWVRNPVDNFVLARLEKEGLAPSTEASKEALIRRVSLDLTGLPPSVKEIDEFLADTSPDASEKVVDRLLASRTTASAGRGPWLDLARYADNPTVTKRPPSSIWKYRDWVIDALQPRHAVQDQVYGRADRGRHAARATIEQKIATGLHRMR